MLPKRTEREKERVSRRSRKALRLTVLIHELGDDVKKSANQSDKHEPFTVLGLRCAGPVNS